MHVDSIAQHAGATYRPNNRYVLENQLIVWPVKSKKNAIATADISVHTEIIDITNAASISCLA